MEHIMIYIIINIIMDRVSFSLCITYFHVEGSNNYL